MNSKSKALKKVGRKSKSWFATETARDYKEMYANNRLHRKTLEKANKYPNHLGKKNASY